MTDSSVARVLKETRKNYNFGTAVIFDGRCIQAYPNERGTFTLLSGCYTTTDGLPEFEAMKKAGTLQFKTMDMGSNLISVSAEMNEEQFRTYLAAANEADWEH